MPIPKKLKQWNQDLQKERREHPTLPTWAVKQIVRDHEAVKPKHKQRKR